MNQRYRVFSAALYLLSYRSTVARVGRIELPTSGFGDRRCFHLSFTRIQIETTAGIEPAHYSGCSRTPYQLGYVVVK